MSIPHSYVHRHECVLDGVGSSDITGGGPRGDWISTGAHSSWVGGDRPAAVTARSIDFNAHPLVKCHLVDAGRLWINHLKVHSHPRLGTPHAHHCGGPSTDGTFACVSKKLMSTRWQFSQRGFSVGEESETGMANGRARVHTERWMWGEEGVPVLMPLYWGAALAEIYDVLVEVCSWMMVALRLWVILVALAQLGNALVLSYRREIHLLAEMPYFPLPQADAGGLSSERGCVCSKYYSLLEYRNRSLTLCLMYYV